MRSLIGLVLLTGIGLTIFWLRQEPYPSAIKVIQSDCHFEQGLCSLELSKTLNLSFQLTPLGVPAMEPLLLKITGLDGLALTHAMVKVWFEGKDMYMGQHFMLPVQEETVKDLVHSSGELAFQGMIPVCSLDENMVWRLVVELPLSFEQANTFTLLENTERQQIHFELQ